MEYNDKRYGGRVFAIAAVTDGSIAQPGERPPHTREVAGSSPAAPMPEALMFQGFFFGLRAMGAL